MSSGRARPARHPRPSCALLSPPTNFVSGLPDPSPDSAPRRRAAGEAAQRRAGCGQRQRERGLRSHLHPRQGLDVRKVAGEALISMAALVILLAALMALDPRVRDHVKGVLRKDI